MAGTFCNSNQIPWKIQEKENAYPDLAPMKDDTLDKTNSGTCQEPASEDMKVPADKYEEDFVWKCHLLE